MATYNAIKYNVDYGGFAGTYIPLASTTISSSTATVSFTSGIDSTYKEYFFILNNIHPSQDNADLSFQVSTDGGSSYGLSGVRFGSHALPTANNTYDLGTTALRWRNLYVNDLQLSNKAKKEEGGNDVDGTWGDFTIQEGESDLFLINNRSGKKYKFNLTEVN